MNATVNRNELSSTRMARHDFLYLRIGELPIHTLLGALACEAPSNVADHLSASTRKGTAARSSQGSKTDRRAASVR